MNTIIFLSIKGYECCIPGECAWTISLCFQVQTHLISVWIYNILHQKDQITWTCLSLFCFFSIRPLDVIKMIYNNRNKTIVATHSNHHTVWIMPWYKPSYLISFRVGVYEWAISIPCQIFSHIGFSEKYWILIIITNCNVWFLHIFLGSKIKTINTKTQTQ